MATPTPPSSDRTLHTASPWARVPLVLALLIAASGCTLDGGASVARLGQDSTDDTHVEDTPNDSDGSVAVGDVDGDAPGEVELDGGDAERALRPVFEPDAAGFFRMPWPSDARRTPAGMVELSDFPNAGQSVLADYIDAMSTTDGFSTMPVIYLRFEGHFEVVPLLSAAETLDADAWAQLIDVTPGSCGVRVPIDLRYHDQQHDRYTAPKLLSAVPVPGFVLTAGHRYAYVILHTVGAEAGLVGEVPAAFDDALRRPGSGPIADSLAPLRACLPETGLTPDDLLVATVFTVGDAVRETRKIRDVVLDHTQTPAPVVDALGLSSQGRVSGLFVTYEGSYQTPIFQAGTPPYNTQGQFVFDAAGEPVVQRWESVRFTLTVPSAGSGPFPVMVWASGTGASLYDYTSHDFTRQMVEAGFAVATFQPQMHGDRSGPTADPVMHSFNYANPASGRTVFRQQVIDTAYFVRVLREAVPAADGPPALEPTRLVYAGHSQGGFVGAMVAGVETEFEAYVLNGTGSYLSVTAVQRRAPIDVAALVSLLFGLDGELDIDHPLVQLAQLAADPVDPHNYAPYWSGDVSNPRGASVFLINGGLDPTTYPRSINAITIAGNAVVVQPAGWDIDPADVWEPRPVNPPVAGNRVTSEGTARTLVSYLDASTGHFTLADVGAVRAAAVSFLRSAHGGDAVLPTF